MLYLTPHTSILSPHTLTSYSHMFLSYAYMHICIYAHTHTHTHTHTQRDLHALHGRQGCFEQQREHLWTGGGQPPVSLYGHVAPQVCIVVI
jgi:hypothetical protein